MLVEYFLCAALPALVCAISGPGLHQAIKHKHLQIPPSFSGKGITLYPAHHPDHDATDLAHLIPQTSQELYYTQEGHRPAIHGSKHASLKVNLTRPTIVLDHSHHIRQVRCGRGSIRIGFANSNAFQTAVTSWPDDFTLITYHRGCGDETKGKRSHFHAVSPLFDREALQATVLIRAIDEPDSMESGTLTWGTYESPEREHKRMGDAIGHISLIEDDTREGESSSATVNLNTNATARRRFFGDAYLNVTHPGLASGLDFTSFDGTVPRLNRTRRPRVGRRQSNQRDPTIVYSNDVEEDTRSLAEKIGAFVTYLPKSVWESIKISSKAMVFSAKLLATLFGVPFRDTYKQDFNITNYLHSFPSPPAIFDLESGYTLYDAGENEDGRCVIQCAKCGFHASVNIDGGLAFSIDTGITEGRLVIKNYDPMTVDAQIGVTRKSRKSKSKKSKVSPILEELLSIPLGPFGIPDIFTLGPQLSISAAVEVSLEGQINLLVGGSLAIGAGTLDIDLKRKDKVTREGLEVTFTPVFKASGEATVKLEFGLPVALEVGLDVFKGKFKKTGGFVEKPSIYVSATAGISTEEEHCENGVQLRVGVENTVSVQVFGLWERDLFNTVLYDHGIGCVSANGFDPNDVNPDNGVIKDLIDTFKGRNTANPRIGSKDVASTLTTSDADTKVVYVVIMDAEESTILVSGTDGGIYLVKTSEANDLSAPWGSVGQYGTIVRDTFGRQMSYTPVQSSDENFELIEISLCAPHNMLAFNLAVGLEQSIFASNGHDLGYILVTSALYFKELSSPHDRLYQAYAPIFLETKDGLRLYGARPSNGAKYHDLPKGWHLVALKGSEKNYKVTSKGGHV